MKAKKLLVPLMLAVLLSAMPPLFLTVRFLYPWEHVVYDTLCRRLVEEDTQSDVISLILIDNQTLQFGVEYHDNYEYFAGKGLVEGEAEGRMYGAGTLYVWPWRRSVYEILINFLAEGGARAVVFDLVFSTPHPSGVEEDDYTLGLATLMMNEEGSTVVIHTINFHEGIHPPEDPPAPWEEKALEAAAIPVKGLEDSPFPFDRSDRGVYYDPILPYRAILADALEAFESAEGVLRLGAVSIQPDADAVIRRARVLTTYRNRAYPSLGLAAALVFLEGEDGRGNVALGVNEGGLFLERAPGKTSRTIPLTPSGDLLVHFKDSGAEGYEGEGRFKTYPAFRILLSALRNRSLVTEMGLDPDAFLVKPEVFKDRIVFIGANAEALYDLKATPIAENYPGFKVHAAVVENLLEGDPIRRLPLPGRAALAAAAALLALLSTLLLKRASWKILAVTGILLGYGFLVFILFTSLLLWIDTVIPVLGILLAYTAGTSYNYFTEGVHKREITRIFRHYVPPSVVEKLVANPEALNTRGERVEITVFFSDIQGFTRLSNTQKMRENPAILTNHLNDYLNEMTGAIHALGGTLDKYIGDAVVAFFGAPLAMDNHAREACRAAILCQQRLEAFNARVLEKGLPPLKTRIGLYSGEAMVGNVGSTVRLSYTAIGSPVNFGARLEGVNKVYGTWILAGEPTVRLAGESIVTRYLDTVRVPGIEENAPPLRLYQVLASADEVKGRHARLLALFERAVIEYRAGRFDQALTLFEQCAVDFDDPPSRTFADRSRRLMEQPPENWDGVFRIESK